MERLKALGPFWIILVACSVVILMILLGAAGRSGSILDKPLTLLDRQWSYESGQVSGITKPGETPIDLKTADRVTYSTSLPLEYTDPHSLIFRTIAQKITVLIDGLQTYSFGYPPQYNQKIPVGGYHLMAIPPDSHGKTLEIRFENFSHGSRAPMLPEVIIGQGYTLFAHILIKNIGTALLGVFVIIMGLGVVILSLIMASRNLKTEGILFFGVFSLLVGIWAILATNIPQLIFGTYQSLMVLKISCIMLCAAPFGMFVMHVFHPQKPWMFRLVTIALLANYILSGLFVIFIQSQGILTLLPTHMLIFLMCTTILYTLIKAVKHKSHSEATWMLIGFSILAIGIFVDILRYYVTPSYDNSQYFMVSLLVLTVLAGYRTSIRLLDSYRQGVKAEMFQKIAFTDILTGLPNRTAFEDELEHMRNDLKRVTDTTCIMLDLDHLKQINDNFGHKAGDAALRKVAHLIKEVYAPTGALCYRIGGDEFVVIMERASSTQISALAMDLKKRIEEINLKGIVPLSISSGYASGSFPDVANPFMILERADAMMYRNKRNF
jgi:diguanylate cyclase (GGDEF)-like protein